MKLLADEGIEREIILALREAGHAVDSVSEQTPGETDERVFRHAVNQDAILLTSDKDFGDLVFRQRLIPAGVVLLRLAGLPGREKASIVVGVFGNHARSLQGAFTVITGRQLRIRPLP